MKCLASHIAGTPVISRVRAQSRRLLLLVSAIAWISAWSFAADSCAAELEESLLRERLQQAVSQDARLSADATAALAKARIYLSIRPEDVQVVKGGRIQWQVSPQRPLTPEETKTALDAVQRFLLLVLQEPLGERPPLLSKKESELAIARLEVGPPPQWRNLNSLSSEEVTRIFNAYLKKLQARSDPRVSTVEECGFDLKTGAFFSFSSGHAQWHVQPSDKEAFRRAVRPNSIRKNSDDLTRAFKSARLYARHWEQPLKTLISEALSREPDPKTGVILLQPLEAAKLSIEVHAEPWEILRFLGRPGQAMAAGIPGLNELLPAFNKGQAERMTRQFTWSNPNPISSSEFPPERLETTSRYDEQLRSLVIDTRGYCGPVVNGLAFSPDGTLLAAAGDVARIWSTTDGRLLHTLWGGFSATQTGPCTDVAFTPDGRYLVLSIGGIENSLRVYDLADSLKLVDVLAGHRGHVEHMALSPNGRWLVTAGSDKQVHVWDWPARRQMRGYQYAKSIDHLSFPDSQTPFVLSVNVNGVCSLFEIETSAGTSNTVQRRIATFLESSKWPENGEVHPFAIDFQLSRKLFLAGVSSGLGSEKKYRCAVWLGDEPEPKQIHVHDSHVTTCALSPDGQWAASADALGEIHIWGTESGKQQFRFTGQGSPILSLGMDREGLDWQIKYGRNVFAGKDYAWNHYAPLDRKLSLTSGSISLTPAIDPPAPGVSSSDLKIGLVGSTKVGEIELRDSGNRIIASLPIDPTTQTQPLAYGFLKTKAESERRLVLGWEDGGLNCFETNSFMTRRTFLGHTSKVRSWQELPDHNLLASCSADGTIRIWSLKNFTEVGNLAAYCDPFGFVYHTIPGTSADRVIRVGSRIATIGGVSPGEFLLRSEKYPATVGSEVDVELEGRSDPRSVKLSNMGDVVRPLVSIFISRDDSRWVAWTNGGYYTGSPGAGDLVGWLVSHGLDAKPEYYPLSHFKDRFERADIVRLTLEMGDEAAAIKEANPKQPPPKKTTGLQPSMLAQAFASIPEVQISTPQDGVRTADRGINVRVQVTTPSPDTPPLVTFKVNGSPVIAKDAAAGEKPKGKGQIWIVDREIPLRPGENTISVEARADGITGAGKGQVKVHSIQTPQPKRLFVLSMACETFKSGLNELKYAPHDASEFVAACEKQKGLGLYDDVISRSLLNDQVTSRNLKIEIEGLAEKTTVNDTVFVFVSTHGTLSENQEYFLIPTEGDPQKLLSTCIPASDFESIRTSLPGRRIVFFMDTCHAAGVAQSLSYSNKIVRRELGIVYSACTADGKAIELEAKKHGAFTLAFLNVLTGRPKGDSAAGPEILSAEELASRLRAQYEDLVKDETIHPALHWDKPLEVQGEGLLHVSAK